MAVTKKKSDAAPRTHHLDRRAADIAARGAGDADDLLTTRQVADWLGVAEEWVENGRQKKFGPTFTRLSSKIIRYRRADVLKWLRSRTHASTAEYV